MIGARKLSDTLAKSFSNMLLKLNSVSPITVKNLQRKSLPFYFENVVSTNNH